MSHTVVIGVGPAGLTTAYELSKHRQNVTVLDASDQVGGLFRTENYQGYRIDLGAGGFSTQDDAVQQIWNELVGTDTVEVKVRSLIYFHHRLFKYPLSATNALKHLGPIDTALTGLSYLKHWLAEQQTTATESLTSKDWIDKRFGPHLNRVFFKPYFEKVWGRPDTQLAPNIASRSLTRPSGKDQTLVRAAIDTVIESTPQKIDYPASGSGQAWQTCKALIQQASATLAPETQPIKIEHSHNRITGVIATAGENIQTIPVDHLVSSLPLSELAVLLNAPDEVQHAADNLRHRHLIQVALILETAELFSEQWMYINNSAVQVSRIQNFKNWSPQMVPNLNKTCLGLTYFCNETDALWHLSEVELVELASQELMELGLIDSLTLIEAGTAVRQKHAYAVHTPKTFQHRAIVQAYCDRFENLQTIGSQGLHRTDSLSDCILSGQQAADNIFNSQPDSPNYNRHNLWKAPSKTAAVKSMTF